MGTASAATTPKTAAWLNPPPIGDAQATVNASKMESVAPRAFCHLRKSAFFIGARSLHTPQKKQRGDFSRRPAFYFIYA